MVSLVQCRRSWHPRRRSICELLQRHDLQFKTFDIRATDTMAVKIGETIVMVGEQRIVGRYMHLWQLIDGQLLLTRDMYHVLAAE